MDLPVITIKFELSQDGYGGVGIFAGENIRRGDMVWRAESRYTRRYSIEEYKNIIQRNVEHKVFLEHFSYPSEVFDENYWVPFVDLDTDVGSFLNHSENPNLISCDLVNHPYYGDKTLTNIAVRDIRRGEQLTYDYRGFVLDIEDWQAKAKVRTCVSFLLESQSRMLSAENFKWRRLEEFYKTIKELPLGLTESHQFQLRPAPSKVG